MVVHGTVNAGVVGSSPTRAVKGAVMNRFDLEQAISTCWQTGDDLELLIDNLTTANAEFTREEFITALRGVQALQNLRVGKLFQIFERMVRTNKFNDDTVAQ
jgi:hypothetical protein